MQDFNAESADIKAEQIKSEDGDPIEIVDRVACLVYGESLIIENARVYGALHIILTAIRQLIRRHAVKNYPESLPRTFPLATLRRLPNFIAA